MSERSNFIQAANTVNDLSGNTLSSDGGTVLWMALEEHLLFIGECSLYLCTDSKISDPVYGDDFCAGHVEDFRFEADAHRRSPHLF